MRMKRLLTGFYLAAVAFSPLAAQTLPGDAEIRKILAERIDAWHQGVGIVVGVIDASGRRVVSHGTFDNDGRPVTGETLFEIGSASKVFTSLLLADAVARGEVSLNDPVAKYLPAEVKVPDRNGKKITLLDLATHTSALPRMPSNFTPKDPKNPYADYTEKQLYEFLSSYELPRDIGSRYEYSNLAVGLLGHVLARRAGTDYETLLRTRVLEPLGMKSTAIALNDALQKRLAPGHNPQRERVPNWDLPTLAGAGAIRSTADDLLTFLAANLGYVKSPLAPAMESMLRTRRPTTIPDTEVALAWHITKTGDRELVWHNGGTGGYRSYIGMDPKRRTGVVVLSNMLTTAGVDDIGGHLLDASLPLRPAPKPEISVAPELLQRYVGRYELAPNFILSVTREGTRLFTQATGQPKFEVFAVAPTEFFVKAFEAQLSFHVDEAGKVSSLTLHQGGRDMPAKKISDEVPPPKVRKEIAVAAEVLERYVGRYQLSPEFVISITREGDHLFLQATGQPRFELFAEGERDFFLKAVDAQVTFTSEGSGKATKLTLHQNGRNVPGPRID
jgi:serine-type D-Ala-D-Ala carboxypeptidase/endopeptidase